MHDGCQVLTVRGRTGCVLLMAPIPSEEASEIAACVGKLLPHHGLRQTKVVCTDDPSAHLLSVLRNVMPKLQLLCLDPVHLCMTFEYGAHRKRTKASGILRAIMQKFNAVDLAGALNSPKPYNGVEVVEFDHVTKARREQILSGAMSKPKAESLLASLDTAKPWQCERDFVEAIAALARCFPEDVDKIIPGPNRSGRQVLYTASAPAWLQWYFNNIRARHTMRPDQVILLPAGTTSNEALHAEVRAWFRETQQMHKSTLAIKLRILHLAKLLSHHAGMYRPTLRQIPSGVVLARSAVSSAWSHRVIWKDFASQVGKAHLPLNKKREQEAALVKRVANKKPAAAQLKKKPASGKAPKKPAAKGPSANQRRTPFTRERISKCRIMGKRQARKRPASS